MATLEVPESGRGNPDGWRALIRPPHLGPMLVLAGGVALYAINVYLTTSLLPSAVEEIGGSRLYAWNTTVFLLASVMSSVLVGRLLASRSGRVAYLLAIGLFVVGTLICAAAPTMVVLLLGRAVQGFGGGLLAGLAYALIRSTLPAALWSRGSALVSAMWGVGTFIGPALGGAFAQYGSWRGAFWALALVGLLIAAAVPLVLSTARTGEGPAGFPLVALILLSAAALVISVASLIATPTVSVLGVLLGAGLVVAFLGYERRAQRAPSRVRVLPAATFAGRSALP
jgi:MFS family permease